MMMKPADGVYMQYTQFTLCPLYQVHLYGLMQFSYATKTYSYNVYSSVEFLFCS